MYVPQFEVNQPKIEKMHTILRHSKDPRNNGYEDPCWWRNDFKPSSNELIILYNELNGYQDSIYQ